MSPRFMASETGRMELLHPRMRKNLGGACLLHAQRRSAYSLGTAASRWPGRAAAPPLVVRRLSTSATVWPKPVSALVLFILSPPWSQAWGAGGDLWSLGVIPAVARSNLRGTRNGPPR